MRSKSCNLGCGVALASAAALTLSWAPLAAAAPLGLSEAVGLALEKNPQMRVVEARVAKARAFARQARAGFWPQAKLEASYAVTDRPSYAFSYILDQRVFPSGGQPDFNDVGAMDNLDVRATVEVPLFTGLQRFRAAEAADRGLEAGQAGVEVARRALALETARAWLMVQKARAFVKAAEAGVRGFEVNLELARNREEAGTLLPQSVLEIETRLAKAREDLSRAENGLALAKEGLRAVLGLDADAPLEVGPPESVPPPLEAEAQIRPELEAMAAAAEAAEKQVEAKESELLPQVGLFGSVGYDTGFRGFQNETGDSVNYVAGIGLNWVIFEGFLIRGQVDEARADATRARAEEQRARIGLRFALQQARINLRDAKTRVEVSAQAIELATRSVDLARARFREGAGLPTQLVDAEIQLTAARIRHAEAKADLDLAAVELRRALGLNPVPNPGESQ